MAGVAEQWTASVTYWHPHRAGLVKLGHFAVPREVEMRFVGDDTAPEGRRWPDARFRFEVIDGAAVCTEAHITSNPGDRAIRTNDLMVFNLDALAEEAFMHFAMAPSGRNSFTRTAGQPMPEAQADVHRAVERGFKDSHAELLQVARVYLDPKARRRPTDSVMEVLGYGSRATASRKVKEARVRGLIPAPGASDADLTAAYASLMASLAKRQAIEDEHAAQREAREWARQNPEAAMSLKADAWQRRQARRDAAGRGGTDD